MSVLKLIGLGLSKKLITEKAIEEIKSCDIIFFETYTSLSCDITEEVIRNFNSNVKVVDRGFIENNTREILKILGEKKSVCILTIGDPMIATTHVSLVVEAKNKGYSTFILPGVSVHCYMISKSMLSSYKFGKSVTIVYPSDNKIDTTPYNVIFENFSRGLHTMLYLDLREKKAMSANEAIKILLEMEKIENKELIRNDRIVIIGQRLGCEDEEVIALTVDQALNYKFKDPPHIIVFPTDKLHFMEVDAIKCLMK